MNSILANTNKIDRIDRKVAEASEHRFDDLCRNCRSLLETSAYLQFEFDDQVWLCTGCGSARKWGNSRPWDSGLRPLLNCERCGCAKRHEFLRVA